jgi:hypothetical protein
VARPSFALGVAASCALSGYTSRQRKFCLVFANAVTGVCFTFSLRRLSWFSRSGRSQDDRAAGIISFPTQAAWQSESRFVRSVYVQATDKREQKPKPNDA